MRGRTPEILDVDPKRFEDVARRAKAALDPKDAELIEKVFDSYQYLAEVIGEKSMSIGRLQKLLGRTNKTLFGARRQTIVRSVLESLRTQLSRYCLGTVVEEIQRWWQRGRSCFSELAERYGIGPPETSVLDTVLPLPS